MILLCIIYRVEYFATDCSSQASMQAAVRAKAYNPDVIIGPPCLEGWYILTLTLLNKLSSA